MLFLTNSVGPDHAVQMRRLICDFAFNICLKTGFCIARPIFPYTNVLVYLPINSTGLYLAGLFLRISHMLIAKLALVLSYHHFGVSYTPVTVITYRIVFHQIFFNRKIDKICAKCLLAFFQIASGYFVGFFNIRP